MTSPCYQCAKRQTGCHSACGEYKEYKHNLNEKRDKKYRQRSSENIYREYRVSGLRKSGKNYFSLWNQDY